MLSACRWCEFGILYVGLPLLFAVGVRRAQYRGAMFPILWVIALLCVAVLLLDADFDRGVLWRFPLRHPYVTKAALRFVVLALVLAAAVRVLAPDSFARFPRRNPRFFALFIVGYPLISVVPQGIIWRVFLAHRYGPLCVNHAMLVVVAAFAFALAHITFRNVVAIVLTGLGGALFIDTYDATGSMWLATLEHGAYGIAAFGLGLGEFLYLGSRPREEPRP
jgi:hypothetical protein